MSSFGRIPGTIDWKDSVRLASTGNIDIATGGLIAVDGVPTVAGDRILLKDQLDPVENGIYLASAGTWRRAPDAGTNALVTSGAAVIVNEGTQAGQLFYLSTPDPIDVGVTPLTFTQFTGGGGGPVPTTLPLLAVANVMALGSLSIAALDDGSVVSMRSVRDLWYLDKTSTLVDDGITVITASGGIGRWIRMVQSHLSWRQQSSWFIDQAAGDDENDGNTAVTALASHEEFQRRIADQDQPLEVDMTVTFTSNYVGDIENTASVSQVTPYGSITYKGQRTVVFSGSVTGVTPWVTGTTAGTFDDAALPVSFTASGGIGNLCVLTSGANAGAASWLTLEPVAKTARYSGFFDDTTFVLSDPSVTDTYDVVTLTSITGKITQVNDGFTYFRDLALRSPGGFDVQIQVYGGTLSFTYCDIECNQMFYQGGGTFGNGVYASKINSTNRPQILNCSLSLYASWFLSATPVSNSAARLNVFSRNIGQQAAGGPVVDKAISAADSGKVLISGEWCVLDLISLGGAARVLRAEEFGTIEVQSSGIVWGLGNSLDHAIEVQSGGVLVFEVPATTRFQVAGSALSDVLVGSVQSDFAGLPANDFSHAAFIGEL